MSELRVLRTADGVRYVRPYLGTDPVTGRRIRPYRQFPEARSDEEALEMARSWLMGVRGSGATGASLGEMLRRHVDSLERMGAAANTVRAYRGYARLVGPLGRVPVGDVQPWMLDSLYARLMREGAGNGPLSAATVTGLHWFLSGAFGHFCELGLVATNPVDSASRPRPAGGEARALDSAGYSELVGPLTRAAFGEGSLGESETTRERACAFAAWLALHTGLRCGEVCALRRSDAELWRSSLHVAGTVVAARGGVVRQPTTKGHRPRNVTLAPEVAEGVRRHMDWERGAVRGLGRSSPLVTWRGRWEPPSSVSGEFTRMARALGLPPGITFHSLRHTHATWLLLSGADPKVVSERLGHADVATTLRIYGHVLPGRDGQAAEAFERISREMGEP